MKKETAKQREQRLVRQREAGRKYKENQTPKQREQRLAQCRDYARERYAAMSSKEREIWLTPRREMQRKLKQEETPVEREERCARERDSRRTLRAGRSPKEKEQDRAYQKEWLKQAMAKEAPAKKEERVARRRVRANRRYHEMIENESPKEKEERQIKDREYKQRQKAKETPKAYKVRVAKAKEWVERRKQRENETPAKKEKRLARIRLKTKERYKEIIDNESDEERQQRSARGVLAGKVRYRRLKLAALKYAEQESCQKCGERDPKKLHFHHRKGNTRLGSVGALLGKRGLSDFVKAEIDKCDVLCARCHGKEPGKKGPPRSANYNPRGLKKRRLSQSAINKTHRLQWANRTPEQKKRRAAHLRRRRLGIIAAELPAEKESRRVQANEAARNWKAKQTPREREEKRITKKEGEQRRRAKESPKVAEQRKVRVLARDRERGQQAKWAALKYAGQEKCPGCGETDPPRLHFHHRKGSTKLGNVGVLLRKHGLNDFVRAEIDKCDVHCVRCHGKMSADCRVA